MAAQMAVKDVMFLGGDGAVNQATGQQDLLGGGGRGGEEGGGEEGI